MRVGSVFGFEGVLHHMIVICLQNMSFFGGNPFASPVGQRIGKSVTFLCILCMLLSAEQ